MNKIKIVKINIIEAFQVGAIIAKLAPLWKGYRKKLLHSSDDFSFEKLHKHLRIKEETEDSEKYEPAGYSKVNVVISKGKRKHDGMKNHLGSTKEHNKFKNSSRPKRPKNGYYVCDKPFNFVEVVGITSPKIKLIMFMLMTT